jgi:hypothetical protein
VGARRNHLIGIRFLYNIEKAGEQKEKTPLSVGLHTKPETEKSLGSRNLIEMKIEQRLIRQICSG